MTHQPTRALLFLLAASITTPLAQSQSSAPTFDIVSIKLDNADHTARSHILSSPFDGRFTAINVPLGMLLRFAFDIPESQISGIPSQLSSLKFDIEARSDPSVDAQMRTLTSDQGKLQKQKMLQALFTSRFKLATHHETRQLPAFALVSAKNGPKLIPAKADGRTIDTGNNHLNLQGVTLAALAEELAKQVGRPVEEKTGIAGRFDITLRWTPDDRPDPSPDAPPGIFTALQEQLGLKLEPTKAPTETLVIDHVELPSAN